MLPNLEEFQHPQIELYLTGSSLFTASEPL